MKGLARVLAAGLLASGVAACGGSDAPRQADPESPAGRAALDGLLPAHLAGFDRVDLNRGKAASLDVTATYSRTVPDGFVVATVRIHPAGSGGSLIPGLDLGIGSDSSVCPQALRLSEREVLRFYPKARIGADRDAFLVKRGAMHEGCVSRVEFDDLLAGVQRPIAMDIYLFGPDLDRLSYEYRFRYPASFQAQPDISRFLEAVPWPGSEGTAG